MTHAGVGAAGAIAILLSSVLPWLRSPGGVTAWDISAAALVGGWRLRGAPPTLGAVILLIGFVLAGFLLAGRRIHAAAGLPGAAVVAVFVVLSLLRADGAGIDAAGPHVGIVLSCAGALLVGADCLVSLHRAVEGRREDPVRDG